MSPPLDDVNQVQFFGLKVPGKGFAVQKVDSAGPAVELIHVTGVALGDKAADGNHIVKISCGEADEIVIGTLHKDCCTQFAVDLIIDSNAKVENSGASAIFLSGYRTLTLAYDDEDGDEYMDDEDEEGSSDEEAPMGVPLKARSHMSQMNAFYLIGRIP